MLIRGESRFHMMKYGVLLVATARRLSAFGCRAIVLVGFMRAVASGATINVGSVNAMPSASVTFDTNLATGGAQIAAVQVDISYDALTPIRANLGGKPDCTVNPAIHKNATAFQFRPQGWQWRVVYYCSRVGPRARQYDTDCERVGAFLVFCDGFGGRAGRKLSSRAGTERSTYWKVRLRAVRRRGSWLPTSTATAFRT